MCLSETMTVERSLEAAAGVCPISNDLANLGGGGLTRLYVEKGLQRHSLSANVTRLRPFAPVGASESPTIS